jgi:undecaprenyl-diphosphatase
VFYILFKEDHWQMKIFSGLYICLTVLFARGFLVSLIRFFYEKPRPFNVLGFEPLFNPVSEQAFPSGHVALLFGLAFGIFLFNKKWGFWYLGFSLINGLARVFSGVHWPLDILGGILVGFISFLLVYLMLEKQYKILYKKEVVS